ncbi:DNA ligase [Emiliania huxleyi virus 202]|nr:DNA ligase [Emiliania huxleyi virus 202]AHA54250.1 putative DNA ligase [Emiliania huxleyi virus 18]AHA55298.1 putative DNA ligase [Emiliania huxleyi virus 156]
MFSGYRSYQVDKEWKNDVPYIFLASSFHDIEKETKRLVIIEHATNAFRAVMHNAPSSLFHTISLMTNTIAAVHEGFELGIGDAIIVKTLTETYMKTTETVRKDLKSLGDLGKVAASYSGAHATFVKPSPLSASHVYNTFRQIATTSGKDSMFTKRVMIKKLLLSASKLETLYLVRALQGKMRIGMAEQSILTAIAYAHVMSNPDNIFDTKMASKLSTAVEQVKQAFCELPDYGELVKTLMKTGDLKRSFIKPGVPVKPMLAKPTNGVTEVMDRMLKSGRFTCDFKYDGMRAQIHMKEDGTISVFSRNMESMTTSYPDVVNIIPSTLSPNTKSFIIDTEAVAVDVDGNILPFQILSTRKRKDAESDEIKVKVCIYAFDILYYNGESTLKNTLSQRRDILYNAFVPTGHQFKFATSMDPSTEEEVADMLNQAVQAKTEGLMVKSLDDNSSYEPSKRSLNWLKLKKDYLAGMGDSCDLVPIAGYHGRGKRTGVYGAYLLAVYDPYEEVFQSVCKIGTGFSDEDLIQLSDSLNPHRVDQKPNDYCVAETPSLKPDVWFIPTQVWEVLSADLSISPVHMAGHGIVDPSKGIALRFPRFIRVRKDKNITDATTNTMIVDMYQSQASVN